MGLKRDSPLAKNFLLCIVLALICVSRAAAQVDVEIPEVARPEVTVNIPEEVPAETSSNDTNVAPAEDPIENAADPVEVLAPQENVVVRSGAYMQYDDVAEDQNPLATGESERQLILPGAGTNVNNQFDHIDGRVLPDMTIRPNGQPYVITNERLNQIRGNFLYWFFDRGGSENIGDYQRDIHSSSPQIHKNFNFQLPFFGFRFNYTRVSVNGYLEFSDPPDHYRYPLTFPIRDWPQVNDPSFIGIFFSKCRIGAIRSDEVDQRRPGVYFRMDRDLQGRTDQFGVEMRERVTWDVRQGVIGADNFFPKHAVTVTWKNVSFLGGIDNSLYTTNSFQMVLATDEVITYAIFNYVEIRWSSHTQAGGDTTGGEGGTPAYVGFNAGNGTRSFEYLPYSQAMVLRDLTHRGWGNGFPGRHIFRIDEKILLGSCNKDIDGANLPLMFAPESGNMLGGTIVNITGPCFFPNDRISCRFDTVAVVGAVVDSNRAICVQPRFLAEGYQRFEIAINNEPYKWKGVFFVETPATAAEKIFFTNDAVHQANPSEITITWDQYNLTTNLNIGLKISLYGYRETTIRPEFELIDILEDGVSNTGFFTIAPNTYRNRDNFLTNNMEFGYIQITLTAPVIYNNIEITPILWSRPIPLGWYFGPQWERLHGQNWPNRMCNNWLTNDRFLRNFAAEVWLCPCTLEHAILDKGRFLPDFACDRDINPRCQYHQGAIHCVRSGNPSWEGSGQQCCYDKNGFLMLSYDQQWGSRPHRSHNLGLLPWTEANKVPTNSHWFHDMIPFYQCCLWQSEQAVGCETFRFERRPSQDCVAYQPPGVAGIFGDPHLITFDDVHYTFNGKGEFVLLRVDDPILRMEVQGRFEQVGPNRHGLVNATHLTSVVARANSSIPIEVRIRPKHAQWRYRLDVFADEKRIYFDRPALKVQHFRGVTVYTPTYILNQSEVIIMFPSGAGIEVVENQGFMTARVYLPWTYINRTRGLFGNWSWDMNDDFMRPDGTIVPINLANFQSAHNDFAAHWQLSDRHQENIGRALFVREFGRTAAYYSDATFVPNFIREPANFLPPDRIVDINRATELCDNSYQCRFDYGMSLNRDMAEFTKNYYSSIVNIRETNDKRVLSCGILETPRFGRKTTFMFTPGTRVTFECDQNFFLNGDRFRTCEDNGRWNLPEFGFTECLRHQEWSQRKLLTTGAIIMAFIVPILLALMLFYFWCVLKPRKKGRPSWNIQKLEPMKRSISKLNVKSSSMGNLTDTLKSTNKSDNSDIKDPILDSPNIDEIQNDTQQAPFSRSAAPQETDRDSSGLGNSDKSDKSDLSSLPKKRRAYDKVYRTREPLPPDMEFPEKLWDLSEEDVTSYDSNDSGSNKDTLSKPTKDFEYRKPKQLGRRGMSPQVDPSYAPVTKDSSGYASEDPYNVKPQNHGSPQSSYYSPTYSEIYSPPLSPTSDSGRAGFYPPNEMATPHTAPHDSLKTFTLPIQRGEQNFSQRMMGIAGGIIAAIIAPIILILACIGYRLLKKKKKEERDDQDMYPDIKPELEPDDSLMPEDSVKLNGESLAMPLDSPREQELNQNEFPMPQNEFPAPLDSPVQERPVQELVRVAPVLSPAPPPPPPIMLPESYEIPKYEAPTNTTTTFNNNKKLNETFID